MMRDLVSVGPGEHLVRANKVERLQPVEDHEDHGQRITHDLMLIRTPSWRQ